MKYYIKQKVFSIGESFTVVDETGAVAFYVEGSFMAIPKSFRIYDANHHEVCFIEKQLFRFMGHYNIQAKGHARITLARRFMLFFQSFEIEGLDWMLEGSFTRHNYRLIRGQTIIMALQKHWFTWGDSYELNVLNPDDAVLALAIAICVDREIMVDSSNS